MRYYCALVSEMEKLVKIIATIALSLIAIVAGLVFAGYSLCTFTGAPNDDGRMFSALCALVALAAMLGAVWLVRKLRDNW